MLAKHSKIILVHSCSLPFSLCLLLPYSIVISYFRPFCLSAPSGDLHPQLSGSDRQPACHLTCLIAYKLLAVNSPIRNCVHSPLLLLTAALQREEEKECKERKRGSGWEKGERERGIQSAFPLKGTGPSFTCKACSNSLHLNEFEQDWLCFCSGSCVFSVCVRWNFQLCFGIFANGAKSGVGRGSRMEARSRNSGHYSYCPPSLIQQAIHFANASTASLLGWNGSLERWSN